MRRSISAVEDGRQESTDPVESQKTFPARSSHSCKLSCRLLDDNPAGVAGCKQGRQAARLVRARLAWVCAERPSHRHAASLRARFACVLTAISVYWTRCYATSSPQSAAFMFRFAIITAIALRVMLCPLYCGGGVGDARAGGITATGGMVVTGEINAPAHCGCSDAASGRCGNEPQPAECPGDTTCTCVCFCDAVSGASDRPITVDLTHSLDLAPVDVPVLDFSKVAAVHRPVNSHRLNPDSGRSIRLAFSSLLI